MLYQMYLYNQVWRLSERKEKRVKDPSIPDWRIVNTMREEDFNILIEDFPQTKNFIETLDCNKLEELEFVSLFLIFELVDLGSYSDKFIDLTPSDHLYWYAKVQKSESFPYAIDALCTLLKG